MKRIAKLCLVLVSLLGFTACSWQLPEKISVKTDANYKFNIGKAQTNLKDKFDISTSLKTENDIFEVYDYFPGKANANIQQFLLRVPVQDIEMDFSKIFESTELSGDLTGLSYDQNIEVPEITSDGKCSIEIDTVRDIANITATAFLYSTTDGHTSISSFSYDSKDPSKKATFTGAAHYYSGSKIIVTGAILGKKVVLRRAGREYQFTNKNNTTAELDIATLGGMILATDDITIGGNLTAMNSSSILISGKLSKITGLSLTGKLPVNFKQTEIALSSSDFVNCVLAGVPGGSIDGGEVKLTFGGLDGWSGVAIDYAFKSTGGLVMNTSRTGYNTFSNPEHLEIDGKTVNPKNIKIDVTADLNFANATVVFSDKPVIEVTAAVVVKKFQSITVKYNGETLIEKEEDFPGSASMIQQIVLDSCGLEGTYINTLPDDIIVKTTSAIFGMSGKTATLYKNKSTATDFDLTGIGSTINADPVEKRIVDKIKMKVEVILPNWDAANKTTTVNNVVPGSKYRIAIDVKPKINWKSVTLDTQNFTKADSVNTKLNMSALFENMKDALGDQNLATKLSIPNLPILLYFSKPSSGILDDIRFTGALKLSYKGKKDDAGDPVFVPGTDSAGNPIKPMYILGDADVLDPSKDTRDLLPEVRIPEIVTETVDEKEFVVTDLESKASSIKANLAEMLDYKLDPTYTETTLYLDYDLAVGNAKGNPSITITNTGAQLEDTAINIEACLILPLNFRVKDDFTIDIMSLMDKSDGEGKTDKDKDLLGRSEKTDTQDIDKFLEAIEYVSINYSCIHSPIYSKRDDIIKLVIDMDGPDGPKAEQSYNLLEGKFSWRYADIETILKTYPLQPAMNIKINKGDISIPRIVDFDLSLEMELETDGTIELTGGK